MILDIEELEIIKTIIPAKNYRNTKMILDTTGNKIIATDGTIAIEMVIDTYRENSRLLSKYVPHTCEIPLFQLKNLMFLTQIIYKHYGEEKKMKEGQLMSVPVDLYYFIGDDTVILDNVQKLNSIASIQEMIEFVHSDEDHGLFPESRPEMYVSKSKMKFDRVIEKLDKQQKYSVGPEFIIANRQIKDNDITVFTKSPVVKHLVAR